MGYDGMDVMYDVHTCVGANGGVTRHGGRNFYRQNFRRLEIPLDWDAVMTERLLSR